MEGLKYHAKEADIYSLLVFTLMTPAVPCESPCLNEEDVRGAPVCLLSPRSMESDMLYFKSL